MARSIRETRALVNAFLDKAVAARAIHTKKSHIVVSPPRVRRLSSPRPVPPPSRARNLIFPPLRALISALNWSLFASSFACVPPNRAPAPLSVTLAPCAARRRRSSSVVERNIQPIKRDAMRCDAVRDARLSLSLSHLWSRTPSFARGASSSSSSSPSRTSSSSSSPSSSPSRRVLPLSHASHPSALRRGFCLSRVISRAWDGWLVLCVRKGQQAWTAKLVSGIVIHPFSRGVGRG